MYSINHEHQSDKVFFSVCVCACLKSYLMFWLGKFFVMLDYSNEFLFCFSLPRVSVILFAAMLEHRLRHRKLPYKQKPLFKKIRSFNVICLWTCFFQNVRSCTQCRNIVFVCVYELGNSINNLFNYLTTISV